MERLLGPLDVLHLTDYAPLRTARTPIVAMVHDVLFRTLPGCYPSRMGRRLDAATRGLVRIASRVVVPSVRTRDALCEHYDVCPDTVHVTPLGARALPSVAPTPSPRPFALVVGSLVPRKNHLRLVRAFAQLSDSDVDLVIAGARGWQDDQVLAAIAQTPRVTWVADPDDRALAALYGGCAFVAVPSLDEGFGLPVVEALAMGKAVFVGHDTACADVAGPAGLPVDVRDVDAIAQGLQALFTNEALRRRLQAAGGEQVARYTWTRTAAATAAVYESVLA